MNHKEIAAERREYRSLGSCGRIMFDIYEYMEDYNRAFDGEEFDKKLWEAMQEEEFELDDTFRDFCIENGIGDLHGFLKEIRRKHAAGRI